jgi:hypothetical protein
VIIDRAIVFPTRQLDMRRTRRRPASAATLKTFQCFIRNVAAPGDPAEVKLVVTAGNIIHGDSRIDVPGAEISLPTDAGDYWIAVYLRYNSGVASTEVAITDNDDWPEPASNEYVIVLRGISKADGEQAALNPITNYDGDIYIHGAFAP